MNLRMGQTLIDKKWPHATYFVLNSEKKGWRLEGNLTPPFLATEKEIKKYYFTEGQFEKSTSKDEK